ncbi:hypothetical protein CWS02_21450 [Enterobacter sp. EA-1]|nr:hypothetical protein CWS02_21450 [Enterobacter sp. EA-1]
MECLTGVLPQLTNRLAPRIATAAGLSGLKTRRILSMLLYWLSQHHSGQSDALPGREEVMDIFSSILENTTLCCGKPQRATASAPIHAPPDSSPEAPAPHHSP